MRWDDPNRKGPQVPPWWTLLVLLVVVLIFCLAVAGCNGR